MKKTSLFLIPSLFIGISAAHAQSSVTLYGIVDGGLLYNSNAGNHKQYSAATGVGTGDRWGVKGVEDLGGGLKALFTLESGFNIYTGAYGQGNTPFGRQAFTGLSSHQGTITFGRQTSLTQDILYGFASGNNWAAAGSGYGAHPADLEDSNGPFKINNAVKFQSIDYAGLSFAAEYSFGNTPGDFTRNQVMIAGSRYNRGPLSVGAVYLLAKMPNFSLFGNNQNGSPTASNMTATPVTAGLASASAQQVVAAGGAYKIGNFNIEAMYSNVQFSGLGKTAIAGLSRAYAAYSGNATFNSGELGFTYNVRPDIQLGLSYFYVKSEMPNEHYGAHYHQVNLGASYFLSKSVRLYAFGMYQRAAGTDSTGKEAVASIDAVTPSSGSSQVLLATGMTVRF